MSKNLIITVINIFAFIFVFQIELEIIPLITTWIDGMNVEGLNRAILRISYGIIVSTIFYLLVVSTAESKKRKANRLAIQSRLNSIYSRTGVGSFYMQNKLSTFQVVHDENSSLKLSKEEMAFNYSFYDENTKTWYSSNVGNLNEIQFFSSEAAHVKKMVDEIFAIPNTNTQPNELIKALAKLRDCSLYSIATSINEKTIVLYNNIEGDINEYLRNHRIIEKYSKQQKLKVGHE